jgi:hypothetical protein
MDSGWRFHFSSCACGSRGAAHFGEQWGSGYIQCSCAEIGIFDLDQELSVCAGRQVRRRQIDSTQCELAAFDLTYLFGHRHREAPRHITGARCGGLSKPEYYPIGAT